MTTIRNGLLVALVAMATMAIRCGDTIVNVPTAPQTVEPKKPDVVTTTIEFRALGNPSSVRVRYSSPADGLTQVVTTLPYSNRFTTTETSLFLSLDVTPLGYTVIANPFLGIQIVVGGTTFREATSSEFLLNPLSVSGTWRR